jgi:hypothetical protein
MVLTPHPSAATFLLARLHIQLHLVQDLCGRSKLISSPKCPNQLCGPPSLLVSGYWGSFLGIKWPGHGVEPCGPPSLLASGCWVSLLGIKWPGHGIEPWPSSSAEVKNEWRHTSALPICTHGMDRGNLPSYGHGGNLPLIREGKNLCLRTFVMICCKMINSQMVLELVWIFQRLDKHSLWINCETQYSTNCKISIKERGTMYIQWAAQYSNTQRETCKEV